MSTKERHTVMLSHMRARQVCCAHVSAVRTRGGWMIILICISVFAGLFYSTSRSNAFLYNLN